MKRTASRHDSYALPLADAAATLAVAGGKGSSLARLAAADLPVPPGFHVTTSAYRRFVADDGLHERILAAARQAEPDRPETWDSVAEAIADLIAAQPIPQDVAEAVEESYQQLGDVAVAVRSSATAEDLPDNSFAGQQESYLNIRGAEAVLQAVKRCWASLWTARAIGYRARHRIAADEIALAVVVQQLVPAEAAGIAFTADPVTGARDRVLINAAWGLGEAVVGGQVTPDTIVVAKDEGAIVRQDIADKRTMTVRTPDGTREQDVPDDRRREPALSAGAALELARLALRIEQLYERPMDIEWALHDGQVFIVQARPVTALPDAAPPVPELSWELPDPHGKYVRGSVMELLPDPLSPLFATLGIPAWERATLEHYREIGLPYFDDPLAVINGYGYYNVNYTPALLARMLVASPPFVVRTLPQSFRTAPVRWRAARESYRRTASHWQAVDVTDTPAQRLLGGVRHLVDEAAEYYLTIQSGVLPAAYTSESLFTKAYNTLRHGDDPPATVFLLGFDSKPIRAEQSLYDLARWVRTQPGLAERLTALSGEEREHLLDVRDSNTGWTEFQRRLREHLAAFGDMVYDLDFAKPLPGENPAALLQTLNFFLTDDAPDPRVRQQNAAKAREKAVRVLERKRPGVRRAAALRLLSWAQAAAPRREDALADVGAGWPAVRRMLGEIGRRLVSAGAIESSDDVYWLRLPELESAAQALDTGATPGDSHSVVAERRALWQAQRAMPVPHVLPVKGGNKILGIEFARSAERDADEAITGTPGSPGKATGSARIIHDPSEFDTMRPGDVLIAKMTTPAWTPLFALASAVVTDVGGALSHSSIVAREYHIPAVLGTGDATARIQTGQHVTVDGDTGAVTVLDHSGSLR
ncbi:PEP/pyruvate-binding domain-containing protein [Nocardia transvalensis]|uniref:PEP/pyruvate-binding domain-containing protein n=1 Tax=Nocardia transvalensis TaxID=37333 RepID=UPI001895CE22|nr:PEP/pyruvate-binding domain-containing protein [Nocardia transvalensis]MBF6328129.1 phosphoenolpyruvate synthase [Nocardia transvalensis]